MSIDTNQLIKNRHIRLFISSTFEDMQEERDFLMRRTFPKLQMMAAQRDVMLTAIDLRWGITKEDAEKGMVVDICFREIENSIPFFIGIIGNRYGWCPKPDEIDSKTKIRFPQIKKLTGLSMTEMEIQFAVLKRRHKMHAYFFIKENGFDTYQIEEHEEKDKIEKLALLKETLQKNKRYQPLTYSNEEDLANKVTDAFKKLLDELFKERPLSPISKEMIKQRSFKNQLCHTYVKDERNFSFLNDWLNKKKQRQLVVVGESGIGKSALLANWINDIELKNTNNYKIIYHFVGNGGCEGNKDHIQLLLSEEVLMALGEKRGKSDSKIEGMIEKAFTLVAEHQDIKLILILDGINQLADEDAKSLVWLPTPPNNMKIIFSTLENDKTMFVFKNRHYPRYKVKPIVDNQLKELIIRKYLGNFAKKLSPKQIERIISDSQCNNTLVLISLLNVLVNFSTNDNLNSTIEYFLQLDTIEDYYKAVIKKYEREFDQYGQTNGLVRYALSLILISRMGIGESDLVIITKTTHYYWSQFYCAFVRNFSIGNGCLSFSHQYIFNAVKSLYVSDFRWEKKCRKALVACFIRRDDSTAWNEVPYQYYMLKDYKMLFGYLCRFRVFEYLYKNDRISLIKYWSILNPIEEFSFHNYIIRLEKVFESIGFENIILLFDFCNDELNLYKESVRIAEAAKPYAITIKEKELLYNKLDIAFSNCGLYSEALQYSKQHLDYTIKVHGFRSEETITAYNNLGISYVNLQNYKDSIYSFLNAVRIVKVLYGMNSDRLVSLYDNISSVFNKYDAYNLMGAYYDAARKIEQQLNVNYLSAYKYYDKNDLQAANSFEKIALYYSGLINHEKAIIFYKKELRILQNIFGKYHDRIANVHTTLADEYMLADYDTQKSFNESIKAAHIIKQLYGNNHIKYIRCLMQLGRYAEGDDIFRYYDEALRISIGLLGEENQLSLELYSEIALYFKRTNDYYSAIQYYDKIISLYKSLSFPTSNFYQRIITWRLICVNKVYLHSISANIISVIRDMPLYVHNYRQLKGEEYFSNHKKCDKIVQRIVDSESSGKDIYVTKVYLDWFQLQGSQSRLHEKKQKYELHIGIDFDDSRWTASRISGSSFVLVKGTTTEIKRYINSLSDEIIKTRILKTLERELEKFFYGDL